MLLRLDDSIDIACRLNQLKKSIGLSEKEVLLDADKENINIEQVLNNGIRISKSSRLPQSNNDAIQKCDAQLLSDHSEFRLYKRIEPTSENSSDYTEKQNFEAYFNGLENALPVNSKERSIIELFEEKNTRRNNFCLRKNDEKAATEEEICFPTPNKSSTEIRTLDYSGSHAEKSFELYGNFQNNGVVQPQGQKSVCSNENYQQQLPHSTQIETQRTEAIEEQYLQIVSRLNEKPGSVNCTSIQQLEEFYREENEKLRKRLEDETNYSKQQIEALNLEIQRLKNVINKQKLDERSVESTASYRTRIQELENTVKELKCQLKSKADSEAELLKQLETVKIQFSKREELLIAEVKGLRREVDTRGNVKESQMRLPSDTIRSEYLHQLENDFNMLKAKVEELTASKSELKLANESLSREIDTYKNRFPPRNPEPQEQRGRRKSRENSLDSNPIRSHSQEKSAISLHTTEPSRKSEYNRRPSYSDNFSKEEVNSSAGNFRTQLGNSDENTRYLNDFYYKKFASLSEGLEYWKSRCALLAGDLFQAFQQLREENETYKASVLEVITKLKSDAEGSVHVIKTAYKKELSKIVDTIEDLEEKHISNQVKLANARTRCKNLELAACLHSETLKRPHRSKSAKRKILF